MGLRTLSIETLCVLKLDKHSYQIHINLSFMFDLIVLDMCPKPIPCSKTAQKGENSSSL